MTERDDLVRVDERAMPRGHGMRGRAASRDAEADRRGLTPTLRRGAIISAASLVFVQVVSLGQTLVLARILTPAEVGIFYGGTVLTSLLVTFSEGGIRNALVQRQDDLEAAANTAFLASLAAGTLWSLLALAAAPLVGLMLHSQEAGLVAAVSSGSLLLFALTYVPDALMQRRFDFRQRMIVQPGVTLTFAVSSVALCMGGLGVWGLVIASYASQGIWVAASWSLVGWRPPPRVRDVRSVAPDGEVRLPPGARFCHGSGEGSDRHGRGRQPVFRGGGRAVPLRTPTRAPPRHRHHRGRLVRPIPGLLAGCD